MNQAMGKNSQEHVRRLIKLAQDGDREAEHILVEENAALVHSVARRFCDRGVDYDDLFQIGCLGFLKAIRYFNLEFDVRFSTYVVPMVMGEIRRYLRDNGAIKISRSIKNSARQIMATQEQLLRELGREPSLRELSVACQLSPEELAMALESLSQPLSLEEPLGTQGDNTQSLADTLAGDVVMEETAVNRLLVKELLSSLPPRERTIMVLRYYQDKKQSEIAKVLGVSQVQVSRLESKIIQKLRATLS